MRRRPWPAPLLFGVAGCATAGLMAGRVPDTRIIEDVAPAAFSAPAGAESAERALAAQRAEGYGLVPVPELTAYLNGVLGKLAAASPVTGLPTRVYVTASPAQFGAKSTGDGTIFVCLGTLNDVANEDEAAAVLAHELSHVARGHTAVDASSDVQAHAALWASMALVVHAGVASGKGTGASGALEHQAAALGAQGLLLAFTQRVLLPSWSRAQEREADLLAVDLLAASGYDPYAFETVLDLQLAAEAAEPDTSALGAALGQTLGDVTARYLRGGSGDDVRNAAIDGATRFLLDQLGGSHPSTPERRELVSKYLARHYPGGARERATAAWGKAMKVPRTQITLRNYRNAERARQLLTEGKLADGKEVAARSAKQHTRDHAYPAAVLATAHQQTNDVASALGVLRRAIDGPEPAWEPYRLKGRFELEAGRPDQAARTLEEGYRRLGEPEQAIPYLLFAYQQAGRDDEARRLAAACMMSHPQRGLGGLCQPAAIPASGTEAPAGVAGAAAAAAADPREAQREAARQQREAAKAARAAARSEERARRKAAATLSW
ncbi:MAG: M48 family metalloprotease [bacterium]|nr:M48 family metalloprotease [bacterium]